MSNISSDLEALHNAEVLATGSYMNALMKSIAGDPLARAQSPELTKKSVEAFNAFLEEAKRCSNWK